MRGLVAFAVAWAAVFWFSLLLFGTWDAPTLAACGTVGLVAAAAGLVTARLAPLDYRLRLSWLRLAWSVPHQTVVDFAILTRELARALATGSPREGVFRAKPIDARSAGRRALVGAVAGYSPNAYVVELDPERQLALLHDLVPNEGSEAPA